MRRKIKAMVMVLFILIINTVAQASLKDVEQTAFENLNYEGINLAVVVSEYLLPVGGGQTTTVAAFVTDENNQPVPGICIGFSAQSRHEERNEQLSVRDTFTDENGKASSIYTTSAGDDNEHIFLRVGANAGNDWIDKDVYILASDDASRFEGQISNPFTGEPCANSPVQVMGVDNDYFVKFENGTDEDGSFYMGINPGKYSIRLWFDNGDLNGDDSVELDIEIVIGENEKYLLDFIEGRLQGEFPDPENELVIRGEGGFLAAEVNPDGSLMTAVPEWIYSKTKHENINLTVEIDRVLLSGGGGQSATIAAFVTDENNQPVPGICIGFSAQSRHEERNEQLSVREIFTDENGRASSIYTTLAGDDNEHIFLKVGANACDDWVDRETYILASDDASRCEGRIINPFTGELPFHTAISIVEMDTGYHFLYENIVNEDGFYSIAVPPGNYHIRFLLDFGEENYYSGTYYGSHSRMEADNSIALRIGMKIESNQDYIFNTEMGILKGNVSNLGSSNNLYVTNRNDHRDTVIADVNPDGSFMIAIPEGNYIIDAKGGHTLKESVRVENGQVTDTGSFSR